MLGRQPVNLQAGTNSVRVDARVKTAGVVSVSGRIQTQNLGEARFEEPIELSRAHVLYLSQDPPGTDSNLLGVLRQADIEINTGRSRLDKDLNGFQLVILKQSRFEFDFARAQRTSRDIRQEWRRTAPHRRRTPGLSGRQAAGRSRPRSSSQTRSAQHPAWHLRRSHYRQVVFHGGPQNRACPPLSHRCCRSFETDRQHWRAYFDNSTNGPFRCAGRKTSP